MVDELDAGKKEGLVLSYKILLGSASTPQDYDTLLMIEYKNYAALDNLRAKFDAIDKKVIGTADQQREKAIKRLEIREIMGEKLMQEVMLK